MRFIVLCLLALNLGGCATIIRGVNEDVAIHVTPPDATVTTDIGNSCTGSCTIKVDRKTSFTVTATAPGYQQDSVFVSAGLSGAGAAAGVGNVLIGGVIGAAVDVSTGALEDHTPNPVVIDLTPTPPPPPAPPKVTKPKPPKKAGV